MEKIENKTPITSMSAKSGPRATIRPELQHIRTARDKFDAARGFLSFDLIPFHFKEQKQQ